jgi:hypothetical protein
MKLTIGMASYADFDGVYFTVQSLLVHHQEALQDCEILIVDNAPHLPVAQTLQGYCRSVSLPERPVHYVPFGQAVGTSPARDAIFHHASGEYVLVLDCHVLLALGSIKRLREYLEAHHPCDDLLQGVLISDDGSHVWTHFQDVWRAEMWGIWGSDPRGRDPHGEPFPIFAQGLGLFAARRESWLGFHPLARGFGGEECYIHEKYRQAGRQCLCLPAVRWVHRFARPNGVPYPLTQWNKVRNYVLELRELGLPLDRLHRHFVEGLGEDPGDGSPPQGALTRMSQEDWDYLVADPEKHLNPPARQKAGCGGCGATKIESIEDWLDWQKKNDPDLGGHLSRLQELAQGAKLVVQLGLGRGGATAAFLAAHPKRLVSVDGAPPSWFDSLRQLAAADWEFLLGDTLQVDLPSEPIDVLFIDTKHTAAQCYAELTRYAPLVQGRIVLHDTTTFGERGEDGGPGLLPALRRFLKEHPEWIVYKHFEDWNGLTIISNLPEDRPKLPSTARQIFNFARAAIHHYRDGARWVDEATLQHRLDLCALCEHRSENRCSICGCYLIDAPTGQGGKAEWADQACPLGKWLPVEPAPEPTATDNES